MGHTVSSAFGAVYPVPSSTSAWLTHYQPLQDLPPPPESPSYSSGLTEVSFFSVPIVTCARCCCCAVCDAAGCEQREGTDDVYLNCCCRQHTESQMYLTYTHVAVTFCCLVADRWWIWCRSLGGVKGHWKGSFTNRPFWAYTAITYLARPWHQAWTLHVLSTLRAWATAVHRIPTLYLLTDFWWNFLSDAFLAST